MASEPSDAGTPDPASSAAGFLAAAATRLYAVVPGQFLATRAELARQARTGGEPATAKQIAVLRKPSVAAWTVNHLLRRDPDVVERLLAVGEALRSAQTRLDAAALKGLRAQRESALADVVRTAVRHAESAGQRITTTTTNEVRQSAVAALASPDAAAAFGSGTLTRALSYSGFGEVDIADAVARTGTGVSLALLRGGRSDDPGRLGRSAGESAPDSDGERAAARHEGERRRAELTLARARRDLDAAAVRLEDAREASQRARERVAQLRADLATAEAEDEARLVEVADAVRARSQAQTALDGATRAVRELEGSPEHEVADEPL